MTLYAFLDGLLLGIRIHTDGFNSSGPRFHKAFLAVVEEALKKDDLRVKDLNHVRRDPVFGNVWEAEQMVLEGLHSMVLALESPRLVVANYLITATTAQRELQATYPAYADWFTDLGKIFVTTLLGADDDA